MRGAFAAAAAVVLLSAGPAAAEPPDEFTIEDPRITESSGLQASHRHPGVYWTHNDSDYAPEIYGVDSATGQTVATVRLEGVEFRDVEAIHLGPDGDLYVGDIGDNFDGAWSEVWIYRFPEPAELADATLTPTVYPVQYDDGPRDAEALMVHPDTGRVYLASKKRDDTGAVYAGPEELVAGQVNLFTRMYDTDLWVTDGAFSPDGTRLLLRGYFAAEMFRWAEAGPEPIGMVSVPLQPQGESVTFTPDGRTLMFGSEGAASRVQPVPLEGELLPDSAREADEQDGGSDGDGSRGGSDSAAGGGEESGGSGRLVLVLAGGALLVVALRRLFRGGGKRRSG